MQIRKWASSSEAVMAAFPPELPENKEVNLNTLGLLWAPGKGCFRYKISSKFDFADIPTSVPTDF